MTPNAELAMDYSRTVMVVHRTLGSLLALFTSVAVAQMVTSTLPGFHLPQAESDYDRELLDEVARSKYETHKPYEDIAQGMRIAFIPVAKEYLPAYLGYGRWFYQSQRGEFPVLQMVWPDKQGRLPWEAGYDARFSELQPLLEK